ncbi:MAG: DUF6398 domain-containing protein [Bacteroidetes bacterium]|nr:DUF6398 domain-containing protein [Bacteroidota bacterium]MCL5025213.1 DUF6398 domain-containing protein [Chloroflexota bacterium]
MTASRSESVPKQMMPIFGAIVSLTDTFSEKYLNAEYAQLCRRLAATLCRKRPSPLASGRIEVWACAIVYVIGGVNFLYDKTQTPYMPLKEVCELFGVKPSTAGAKAKLIRDALRIVQLDPKWSLPSRIDDNPLAWLIQVDGLIVDARYMPRPIQEEAFRRGLIPYLPGSKGDE